jgi:hypothetical protein
MRGVLLLLSFYSPTSRLSHHVCFYFHVEIGVPSFLFYLIPFFWVAKRTDIKLLQAALKLALEVSRGRS